MGAHSKDITNHIFGKLTAIGIVGKYHREAVWLCRCECGNETWVKLGNLLRGNTMSCGCLKFRGVI